MGMDQIRALVWKDLRVHWRAAALLLAGWPIGVRVLVLLIQASPDAGGPGLSVVVTMASLLLFVAVAAGLATMLVERERSQETFAWLRTLPVSDAHIVIGKCMAGLVFHAAGYAVWWMVVGPLAPALTVPQAVSVWCVTAVIGSVPLVSLIASSGRLAPAAPVAVLALGMLAWPVLSRSPGAAAAAIDVWRGSWAHPLLWMGCLAAYALLMTVAYWRFHAEDTDVLID
jgi:ABC-type Na+ efflux pump permease subunit